jgi:hypothetical protein
MPMPSQVVTWAARPAGGWGGRARLSVHVTPRLTPGRDRSLGGFPAFRRWTGTVAAITEYRVHIDGESWVSGVRVGPELRPDLWEQLFTDDTFVRPPAYDDLPPTRSRARDRIKADLALRRALDPGARESVAVPPAEPGPPDFHQLWSALVGHPALERLLGIVVDVQFVPPPGALHPAMVWVAPRWDPGVPDSTDHLIPTRFAAHLGGLFPAARATLHPAAHAG